MNQLDGGKKYGEKIEDLLISYAEYFGAMPWPEPGSDAWGEMRRGYLAALAPASPAKIGQAMAIVRGNPPKFIHEHLPEIKRVLDEITEADPRSPGERPTVDKGSPEPTDCETCGGSGWATAYRRDYDGSAVRIVNGRQVVVRVSTPCPCPKGRWVLDKARQADPESKLPDLASNLPAGWTLKDPTDDVSDDEAAEYLEGIRQFVQLRLTGRKAGLGNRVSDNPTPMR